MLTATVCAKKLCHLSSDPRLLFRMCASIQFARHVKRTDTKERPYACSEESSAGADGQTAPPARKGNSDQWQWQRAGESAPRGVPDRSTPAQISREEHADLCGRQERFHLLHPERLRHGARR